MQDLAADIGAAAEMSAAFGLHLAEGGALRPCTAAELAAGLAAGSRGLVIYEGPERPLALALAAGSGGAGGLADWAREASVVLAVVRRHRRQLTLAERPTEATAARMLAVAQADKMPEAALAGALAPGRRPDPVLAAAARLAAAQNAPVQRLLAELRASSPAGAAREAEPVGETLTRIGAAWSAQVTEAETARRSAAERATEVREAERLRGLLMQQLEEVEQGLAASGAQARAAETRAEELSRQLAAATAARVRAETAGTAARSLTETLGRQVRELEASLRTAEAERASTAAREAGLRHDTHALRYEIAQLHTSHSWRVTAPIRRVTSLFRKSR